MHKKFLLIILLIKTPLAFSWSFSLVDKVLYDNYNNCLNNKLKNVDTRKTNMMSARSVFIDECEKAFCSESYKVNNDEYEICIADLRMRCKTYDERKHFSYDCTEIIACPKYKYKDKTCPGNPSINQ